MEQLYELVGRVANTKTNVLVCGESGTGKELVARAIHDQSERREHPFVAVNCGAIPENLLESELFGHVKGSFTGAVSNKAGLFETAHRGTLFLDEIGELPGSLQVKLLRVIQDKALRRVGGTSDHQVDVRIVAATNRKLEEEVAGGRFREDLYYRLNVIQIALPPLRDRLEDVPLLVQHFVEKFAAEVGKPVKGFSEAAMERLLGYAFPGNVRELENMVERAVALTQSDTIGAESLPPSVLEPAPRGPAAKLPLEGSNLDTLVNEFERGLLQEALRQSRGVKKRAAQLLGISFRSFRYRLEKLGMEEARGEEE
jgi:two-component system response regulator PilR (NtrC family)